MNDFKIPADNVAPAIRLEVTGLSGVSIKQDPNDVIVTSHDQAVQIHAWLGEYIEETKPRLPTAGESVVRARVPNGNTISLIFNAVSRSWWANTGAEYDSSELRDWTLIHDAGRPL